MSQIAKATATPASWQNHLRAYLHAAIPGAMSAALTAAQGQASNGRVDLYWVVGFAILVFFVALIFGEFVPSSSQQAISSAMMTLMTTHVHAPSVVAEPLHELVTAPAVNAIAIDLEQSVAALTPDQIKHVQTLLDQATAPVAVVPVAVPVVVDVSPPHV